MRHADTGWDRQGLWAPLVQAAAQRETPRETQGFLLLHLREKPPEAPSSDRAGTTAPYGNGVLSAVRFPHLPASRSQRPVSG